MIEQRSILWALVFAGTAVDFMTRVSMNIAIVDMVRSNHHPSPTAASNSTTNSTTAHSRFSIERLLLDIEHNGEHGDFDWSGVLQSHVLGSFYWLFWCAQLPAGMLMRRFGPRRYVTATATINTATTFLLPAAAFVDVRLVIVARVLQGLTCAGLWSAFHSLCGRWVAPAGRARFVAAYMGCSAATAVCYPLFGWLAAATTWEWVFHASGWATLVWLLCWLRCVYDSPEQHPRLGDAERQAIVEEMGRPMAAELTTVGAANATVAAIPWRAILRSRVVWVIAGAQFGFVWSAMTLLTQTPTYLRQVHGLSVAETGFWCGVPHAGKLLVGLLCGWAADAQLRSGRMSRTAVRRWGTAVCCCGQAAAVWAMAAAGNCWWMAVLMQTLAVFAQGALTSGPVTNIVDVTPRYAGAVMSLTGAVTTPAGCVSAWLVAALAAQAVEPQQTPRAGGGGLFEAVTLWRLVFALSGLLTMVAGVQFVVWTETEVQWWNEGGEGGERKKRTEEGRGRELNGMGSGAGGVVNDGFVDIQLKHL